MSRTSLRSRVLITGVSSGIGRELTKQLVVEGDSVWGVARRKELLINLKKELKGAKIKEVEVVLA